ncbi:hypothetical protein Phi13:2_gp081 [Cellulophaga phage phi13:2]|uniref:Uncharacterized protein n=2 Tax=Pachyviridae TaxID=2946166 RepID=S0A2Q3_9CAUD|nr:hypothetical protein Phi46:3_gp076 [Cellulophaga phage phi46:3]YP_008242106.1 hypothetical protein Phi13:2_gp081 [Cellulophaga phage phi13:2]AGO48820.1 hypothetical protein Phi46:3_gp076 [Cellulophaga phage phi46:3]AGO49691.1 hypothetical protein Phi13:2_gp081 [Cellulophaga phage phi13:2]
MKKDLKLKKGELSDKEALANLSESTRKTIIANKAKISNSSSNPKLKRKYNREDKTVLYNFVEGYNLLQHLIVVRPFICKLYNIKHYSELEALLYLFPIQFFTLDDFRQLGLKQHNLHIKTMEDLGYIELCVKKVDSAGNIYKLTERSLNAVMDFYKYLSGEKTITIKSDLNPFRSSKVSRIDRIREKLMLKLKTESKRSPDKFREKLY